MAYIRRENTHSDFTLGDHDPEGKYRSMATQPHDPPKVKKKSLSLSQVKGILLNNNKLMKSLARQMKSLMLAVKSHGASRQTEEEEAKWDIEPNDDPHPVRDIRRQTDEDVLERAEINRGQAVNDLARRLVDEGFNEEMQDLKNQRSRRDSARHELGQKRMSVEKKALNPLNSPQGKFNEHARQTLRATYPNHIHDLIDEYVADPSIHTPDAMQSLNMDDVEVDFGEYLDHLQYNWGENLDLDEDDEDFEDE